MYGYRRYPGKLLRIPEFLRRNPGYKRHSWTLEKYRRLQKFYREIEQLKERRRKNNKITQFLKR